MIQQIVQVQERLTAANYKIYERFSEQQWVKQILNEQFWFAKKWLIWGDSGTDPTDNCFFTGLWQPLVEVAATSQYQSA